MPDLQKITDYSENLDLLLAQYQESVKLKGLIDSMNDQADDFEKALFEIRDLFYLITAEGVQLDIIGKIFKVEREGQTDEEYRTDIAATASLRASGEPEAIIAILKVLYGATFVTYIPAYPAVPAAFYLITDAIIDQECLNCISPAGVQPAVIESLKFEDDTPIEFEDGSFLYVTKVI
jgi:hypothetical protein